MVETKNHRRMVKDLSELFHLKNPFVSGTGPMQNMLPVIER